MPCEAAPGVRCAGLVGCRGGGGPRRTPLGTPRRTVLAAATLAPRADARGMASLGHAAVHRGAGRVTRRGRPSALQRKGAGWIDTDPASAGRAQPNGEI